jgi:hypothetical protein
VSWILYIPPEDSADLLEAHLVTASDLIWTINIRIFTRLTSPLCLTVQQDCRASFGVAKKVDSLYEASDDELNPEYPLDRFISEWLSWCLSISVGNDGLTLLRRLQ